MLPVDCFVGHLLICALSIAVEISLTVGYRRELFKWQALDSCFGFIVSAIVNLINCRGEQLRRLKLDGESLTDVSFEHIEWCSKLERLEVSFAV